LIDNCSFVRNPDQRDTDHNGKGDACEPLVITEVEQGPAPGAFTAQNVGSLALGQSMSVLGNALPEQGDPTAVGDFGSIEVDIFEVTPTADGTLTALLNFDDSNGLDVDVIIWSALPSNDPTFADVLSFDGASLADPEIASVPVTAGAPIFISVHSYGTPPGDSGDYDLELNLQ